MSAALSACSTLAPAPVQPAAQGQYSGRMWLQIEASPEASPQAKPRQRVSASFELRGQAYAGSLDLVSPLGQVLVRAIWGSAGATLQMADGSTQTHGSLAALVEQAFGEALPVQAWFDWFSSRPWPGAPSSPTADGFEQLGWKVRTRSTPDGDLIARRDRAPAVELRVRFDPTR